MKKPDPNLLSEEMLQKYLAQSLSPAEMHAVEKAMLDAPFHTEAMEGWVSVPEATPADLADLRARLQARVQPRQRQVRLLAPALRVAAAVVALVVAVWWGRGQWLTQGEQATMAKNETAEVSGAVVPMPQDTPDSGMVLAKPVTEPENKIKNPKLAEEQKEDLALAQKAENQPIERESELVQPEVKPVSRIKASTPADSLRGQADELATNSPPAKAPEAELAKPKALANRDEQSGALGATSQRNRKEQAKPAGSTEDLTAVEKKQADATNKLAPQLAAQPKDGWEAFRAYVRQAAKPGPAGKVVLAVTITEQGKVGSQTVTQSLDKFRDREAKRLVARYEGWLPATQNGRALATQLVVEIDF
jgi:TonB family protein